MVPKIKHMFRVYTDTSLAKMHTEKTSGEGNNKLVLYNN